jgi:hypothetical protein
MKTYDILYDPEDFNVPFKVGTDWVSNLSEGDIKVPLTPSVYKNIMTLTLPITCRTNEDFYKLYPEYLI